jgi:hypothetical protein
VHVGRCQDQDIVRGLQFGVSCDGDELADLPGDAWISFIVRGGRRQVSRA